MTGRKSGLIPGNVTWRKTGDEAVLLDLETSDYYSLNETGTFIWELLAAGKTPEKAAAALAAEYGVDQEQAERDLGDFLKDLAKLKVLSQEAAK